MRVKVFVCPKCGTGVFPRTTGDFRTCTCYALGVSGTPETPSLSVGSALAPKVKAIDLDLKTTAAKLTEDWQMMTDGFGLITKDDSRLKQAKPLKQNELALFTQPKQPPAGAEGALGEDDMDDVDDDSDEREESSDGGDEARADEM